MIFVSNLKKYFKDFYIRNCGRNGNISKILNKIEEKILLTANIKTATLIIIVAVFI